MNWLKNSPEAGLFKNIYPEEWKRLYAEALDSQDLREDVMLVFHGKVTLEELAEARALDWLEFSHPEYIKARFKPWPP